MNCTYCSDVIEVRRESWVKDRHGRPHHTECLAMKQKDAGAMQSAKCKVESGDPDDARAAEIGIAPGQGRTAGEVLRAGELVVLMILCMFGVAGMYWWVQLLDWMTG